MRQWHTGWRGVDELDEVLGRLERRFVGHGCYASAELLGETDRCGRYGVGVCDNCEESAVGKGHG